MDGQQRGQKVVDLHRYRVARDRRPLPLFDDRPLPRLAHASPLRMLSARQLAHRERMVEHLTSKA